MVFPPLTNFDHIFVSVSIDFPSTLTQKGMPFLIAQLVVCSRTDWDILCHFIDVQWGISLNSILLLLLLNFMSGCRLELMYIIPHHKYQVKPRSSPWFSAACATIIADRNHFFRLHQQNKSFACKMKWR